MNDKIIWLAVRQALLAIVDAIEREFNITPRTAELRRKLRRKSTGEKDAD